MDTQKTLSFVGDIWDRSILPAITEYIRIPNKSPLFDPAWQEHGHMDRAVALVAGWCREQPIEGLTVEVVRLPDRTPVIYMEIPGDPDDCVLLYGHLDKQPEMVGWSEGLDPWTPVMKGDRLYGRGGADDGYAAFASLTAIRAAREQGGRHARCVVLIEACEESGSFDLPFYIEQLAPRIGTPSLIVCLDSGCGNYDQLWCTTSLRGLLVGNLEVRVLTEGVHSGDASGVVPSSFRILRSLLSRLEDEKTGAILPRDFHVQIPVQRQEQAKSVAGVLGAEIHEHFPFPSGMKPVAQDLTELVLNRTWRPALAITGAAGLPALNDAGNVLRPATTVKVSLRVPPSLDVDAASRALKQLLEKDPPYGCHVTFEPEKASTGWDSPALSPWLAESAARASAAFFGKEAVYMGEGGSIPFMGMLGKRFPEAQFMITGVLGPGSNAHGPNEFLHVPTGKRLTCSVAQVLLDHHRREPRRR
jgi:acetylornithine deacetylase/succinyl-diaminopimelate desuccinylase-like protein